MEEEEDLSHAPSNLKHGTRMVIPKLSDVVDGGEGSNVVQCGDIALCVKVEKNRSSLYLHWALLLLASETLLLLFL